MRKFDEEIYVLLGYTGRKRRNFPSVFIKNKTRTSLYPLTFKYIYELWLSEKITKKKFHAIGKVTKKNPVDREKCVKYVVRIYQQVIYIHLTPIKLLFAEHSTE